MARAKAEHPRTETVLLRFTASQRAVLDAAAHLATPPCTANTYVYRLVEAHIAALLASDELVQASLNIRAKADERAAASSEADLAVHRAKKATRTRAKKSTEAKAD